MPQAVRLVLVGPKELRAYLGNRRYLPVQGHEVTLLIVKIATVNMSAKALPLLLTHQPSTF